MDLKYGLAQEVEEIMDERQTGASAGVAYATGAGHAKDQLEPAGGQSVTQGRRRGSRRGA